MLVTTRDVTSKAIDQSTECKMCQEMARALSIGRGHNLPLLLGPSSSALPTAGYDLGLEVG